MVSYKFSNKRNGYYISGQIGQYKLLECSACTDLFIRRADRCFYKLWTKTSRYFCSKKCQYSITPFIKRPYYYCSNCDRRFTIQSEKNKKSQKYKFCCLKCKLIFFSILGKFPQAWNKGKKWVDYMPKESAMIIKTGLHRFQQMEGSWNKGKPHRESTKIKLRLKRKDRIYPYKDTKPERIMQIALALNNIPFEKHKQFRFGGYRHHRVDIFIKPNFCIEVDGVPFHSSEESIERDKWVNEQLTKLGMVVIRTLLSPCQFFFLLNFVTSHSIQNQRLGKLTELRHEFSSVYFETQEGKNALSSQRLLGFTEFQVAIHGG